jgi:hypothetical protein
MTTKDSGTLTFASDPVAFLEAIGHAAPSKELLSRLAGSVAACMRDPNTAAPLAGQYLRAVAQQLAAETATVVVSASAAGATATASHGKVEVEAELKSVHQMYEIAEVRLP